MLILSLDTSGKQASCALLRDGTVLAFERRDALLDHSRTMLPLCQELLNAQGLTLGDVDLFSAVVGPGSFTGVRIGVSTVKGLAFPTDLPCAAVSTLESLARNVGGLAGRVCALMDARRGQFYYALFENGVRVTEDDIAGADAISPMLSDGTLLVGDGAEVF